MFTIFRFRFMQVFFFYKIDQIHALYFFDILINSHLLRYTFILHKKYFEGRTGFLFNSLQSTEPIIFHYLTYSV